MCHVVIAGYQGWPSASCLVDMHSMDIESLNGVPVPAAATALTADYVHQAYAATAPTASPAKVQLAEAQVIASETLEQLADDGDPLAIDQLAKEHVEDTPIDARALQPPYIDHAPGAHEPGKGDRLDIYD